MKKEKDGYWKKTKMLPAGHYEYKFVVDGKWLHDPECPEMVHNSFGTVNSVVKV